MNVFKLQGEFLGENTYIVAKDASCLIIDPGASADRILDFCAKKELIIEAVLLTHAHIDHTYGLHGLEKQGYPIYLHSVDAEILNGRENLALAFGIAWEPVKRYNAFNGDRYMLPFSSCSVEAIFTPGHTAGSVCYYIEGALFSGDTLFESSYGRTDLPTGDEQDLICSIANELFELPEETPVYAGHSNLAAPENEECIPDTTIGAERAVNPIIDLI